MGHSMTAGSGGACKPLRAPRGAELSCRGWAQEAALRLLMNSLDEEVAGRARDSGSHEDASGPVRDFNSYQAISGALRNLKEDETLLIQSGEAAGVLKARPHIPRVAVVSAHPKDHQPDSEDYAEEQRLVQALFGQDATRSWTSVGSQQALSAVFETLDAIGRARFGGNLAGKLILSGGMGATGGVQPLAATMAGAAFLGIDPDSEKITRRIRGGACDYCVNTLDEALRILKNAVRQKQPVAVGLVGNCAAIIPELVTRGVVPDILSDLTGVSDLLNGYIPAGLTPPEAEELRQDKPEEYLLRARESLARHARGILDLEKLGSVAFDFGNHLCGAAGYREDQRPPGFVSAYLRPHFEEGRAPLRWVALSGQRGDIQRTDKLLLELFPDDARLVRWISLARKHVRFQGLPARVAWLTAEQRVRFAEGLNDLVAKGEFSAPVVIARDQVLCGKESSVSRSGKAAEADQKKGILSTLESLRLSADLVAFEESESGNSRRATLAAVADGTSLALDRLRQVLTGSCAFELFGQGRGVDSSAHVTPGATSSPLPTRLPTQSSTKRR